MSARPPGNLVSRCLWVVQAPSAFQELEANGDHDNAEALRKAVDALLVWWAREFGVDQVQAAMDLAGTVVFGDDYLIDWPDEPSPGGRATDPVLN